jgi:hypothetical protein
VTTLEKGFAMRMYLAVAVLVALLVPALASAKGPASASISGPGLGRALAVRGDGETPGTALGTIASASGFFAQMFGQSPDPTLKTRPAGTLGPRYVAVYLVPGPNDIQSRVVQHLYPYAKPVALTYLKAGQPFWGDQKAHGGWYRAAPALKRTLVRLGLPARAPA